MCYDNVVIEPVRNLIHKHGTPCASSDKLTIGSLYGHYVSAVSCRFGNHILDTYTPCWNKLQEAEISTRFPQTLQNC